ncbi:MAG TPA: hypothetical protein VJ890_19625, partial [Vineibacter sp.]|nr:hypothetical protein [Vineibacter sp.]
RTGPPTDIHGLAATLYHCVTGAAPVSAIKRLATRLAPATQQAAGRYPYGLLAAIDAGLAFRWSDRPESIATWRALFDAGASGPDETETPAAPVSIAARPVIEPPSWPQLAPSVTTTGSGERQQSFLMRVGSHVQRSRAATTFAGLTMLTIALGLGYVWRPANDPAAREPATAAARRLAAEAEAETAAARQRGEAAARLEAEAARRAAEEKARIEAAARQRVEAEVKRRTEAAGKRQQEAEAARLAAEEKARIEAAARQKVEAEAKRRAEAAAKRQQEAEAARLTAEEKARIEAVERQKAEAEAKRSAEAAAKRQQEAEAARLAAEEKARIEAAERQKSEAEAKDRAAAEAKRQQEAEAARLVDAQPEAEARTASRLPVLPPRQETVKPTEPQRPGARRPVGPGRTTALAPRKAMPPQSASHGRAVDEFARVGLHGEGTVSSGGGIGGAGGHWLVTVHGVVPSKLGNPLPPPRQLQRHRR